MNHTPLLNPVHALPQNGLQQQANNQLVLHLGRAITQMQLNGNTFFSHNQDNLIGKAQEEKEVIKEIFAQLRRLTIEAT